MRKRTVRNGMRLVLTALVLIVLASFYHEQLSDLFSLSAASEWRIYSLGIFWAAAIGGYGVVVTALGFALSPRGSDATVRLLPIAAGIIAMTLFYAYLLTTSIDAPARDEQRRIRPGETITI